ncbi:MAG TPA: TonB-dependent receptor [Kofleriaceae bacterium]
MRGAAVVACTVLAVAPARAQPAPEPAPETEADTDAQLRKMAELAEQGMSGEDVIEIYDERPDKPFDRDTDVRLTGEQLAARGATDLASALRLLPDVNVRDAGRGGFNIDVRGGRKGAVAILVDGISVTDPFYGTFDVSTIPVTDIVQIRMSTNPMSPIDGVGGPGGVIEVLTRDAIGPQVVIARVTGDSLPSFGITGTGRAALTKFTAIRLSASGQMGSRDLPLPGKATLDENRRSSTGATRFEYRRGNRRLVLDGFLDSRDYISPPSDTEKGDVLVVDRETSARAGFKADDRIEKLQLQGSGYVHYLARKSRHFTDATLEIEGVSEDLKATRVGGLALATHPIGKSMRWATSLSAHREQANVVDQADVTTRGDTTILEAAGDLQYEVKRLRLDGAVGAAIPLGVDARPWPEGKLVAKYRALDHLELVATGGRKGRLPSLRERFDPDTGAPGLAPEKAWHAELRAIEQLDERVKVEVAPFYRRTTGTIRLAQDPAFPDDPMAMISTNLGRLTLIGIDTNARVQPHGMVEVGASYSYIRARSDSEDPGFAMAPLDRLPSHRADGWVQVTPDPRISVLGRVRYFGDSIDKGATVPGYTTLEATVTAPITKAYLAVLRVDDLTNVAPETRKGYHLPGRVISLVVQGTWE